MGKSLGICDLARSVCTVTCKCTFLAHEARWDPSYFDAVGLSGHVTAIDIAGSDQLWRVPHGTVRDISPVPIPLPIGVPGMGAPIVTSSGLLFLAGAWENVIRAYDADTGEELWKGELPASPQATPMSYGVRLADGSERQFVVIAAGGHARMGSDMGDHLVAFALPEH